MLMITDDKLNYRGADGIDMHLGNLRQTAAGRTEIVPNTNFWNEWQAAPDKLRTYGIYCKRNRDGWRVYLSPQNLAVVKGSADAAPDQAVNHIFLDVQEVPATGARRDMAGSKPFTAWQRKRRYDYVVVRKDVMRKNTRHGITLAVHDERLRTDAPEDTVVQPRKYVVALNNRPVFETTRIAEAVRTYDVLTDAR